MLPGHLINVCSLDPGGAGAGAGGGGRGRRYGSFANIYAVFIFGLSELSFWIKYWISLVDTPQ